MTSTTRKKRQGSISAPKKQDHDGETPEWLFNFPFRFAKFIRIVAKPHDARAEAEGDCWEWIGCLNGKQEDDPKSAIGGRGYGRVRYKGPSRQVHRVMFSLFVCDPEEYLLDHLCRRRACCNPRHLEKTTHHINTIRSARVQEAIWRRLDAKRRQTEIDFDGCSDE